MPLLIVLGVISGLAIVGASTPIAGRGDFGQWLMTSRYYLGLDVPAYRSIGQLPPLVPLILAALQVVIPDPVVALQAFTVGMLAVVAASFYVVGSVLLRSQVGGLLSVIGAFLITDRFLELLAFGGLFQLAAVAFINLAIAAFARAGDGGRDARRCWAIGSVSLVLLALTHVGTATVGIPIALAVAGISVLRVRRLRWIALLRALVPLLIALVALGIYAAAVLAPASKDYVSNPASLFYRGPNRLMSSLFAYAPTAAIVVTGAVAAIAGFLIDGLKRSFGGGSVILTWSAGAWGFVLVAAMAGTGTDYPRFAPIVLAPLVVAAAAALLGLTHAVTRQLQASVASPRLGVLAVLLPGMLAVIAIPFATVRYQSLMNGYQPTEAGALTAAVQFVSTSLGNTPGAVLTSVRDGKWVEGLTGREALFNLPVRFAVRPDEWQRSIDADTILRSSAALTNQFYFVKFSEPMSAGGATAPATTTISMNHGGEFVDVLQLRQADTHLLGTSRTWTAQAGPVGTDGSRDATSATYRTRWEQSRGAESASFSRTVTVVDQASTMSIVDNAPGYRIESLLRPAPGMSFTSVSIDGRKARLCTARLGEEQPCLELWASEPDAQLRSTSQGIAVQTTTSTQLSLYLTDLTAGGDSVGLGLIDPASVIARHDVEAAILLATDPAFDDRRMRLEAVGLQLVRQIGPYAVFQGDGAGRPAAP
ncbi:MAG TPA: hypothetical protein VL749_01780 [Patescibacteria group bacterium]|nr:hypothetical protein [Patescibacteria group bacterium]